jgi:hypothetical protein
MEEGKNRRGRIVHVHDARGRTPSGTAPWIHSTRLHVVLYSLLLILTPFILLQNYLVDLVSDASGATVAIGTTDVPVVPLAAATLLVIAVLVYRRAIGRRLLVAVGIVVLMNALAQQITDIYFGHRFYDLQQNWHYVAYGLFAYMVHRDLAPRRLPLARILWVTFFCALGFSLFDEIFQMRMSSRVFDLSDTSKDVWGCLMGMVLVLLGGRRPAELLRDWRKPRSARLRPHLADPLASLVLMVGWTLVFLCVTALLSDPQFAWSAVGITLLLCAVFLGLFLAAFSRRGRLALACIVVVTLAATGYSMIRHRDEHISHERYGLTFYRGLPIPYFDVLVRSEGGFRLVDKKHYFNLRDQDFLLGQRCDIIIIGSGQNGLGGRGLPERAVVQFLFNPHLNRATQIITLRSADACRLYNRLRQENKSVLFVLHNTC